jgi:pimeloyl-ACP methyl ester carboxylesterase
VARAAAGAREAAQRGLPLLMIHGGAPPRETFERQLELERSRRLLVPSLPMHRHAAGGGRRRDFALDASALAELIREQAPGGAHLLGVSYGAVSALACAQIAPELVSSLILVEAPLFALARDRPEVARFAAALERPFDRAVCTREEARAALGAFADPHAGRASDLGAWIAGVMRFIRGARPPGQAQIDLARLRAAGIRALVVSGAHHDALSIVSERLAEGLGAQYLKLPGWGHFPQRSPRFNAALERFLAQVEAQPTAAHATLATM